jgi:hypothetical protein
MSKKEKEGKTRKKRLPQEAPPAAERLRDQFQK